MNEIYVPGVTQFEQTLPFITSEKDPLEILRSQERGKRYEHILISSIEMDVTIVDDGHVVDLGDNIFGTSDTPGMGQISPINVGVFLEGNIVYRPTDGFHRTEAFISKGMSGIDAIVMYGISMEELYDLRILAANSVKSTKYARIAEWMQKSFQETKWHVEKDLSLLQAFSLEVQDTKGIRLQLTPEEAEELKYWVRLKAQCWGKKASSIYQDLVVIDRADPDLVRQVRVGGGGNRVARDKRINPQRLKQIVTELPNDYDMQQIAANIVKEKDLVTSETSFVSKALAQFKEEKEMFEIIEQNTELVIAIVGTMPEVPQLWKETLLTSIQAELDREETELLGAILAEAEEDEDLIEAVLTNPRGNVEIRGQKSKKRINDKKQKGASSIPIGSTGDDDTYAKKRRAQDYEDEIDFLRDALKATQKGKEVSRQRNDWWENYPDLSMQERDAFELIFDLKAGVKNASKELGITENQLVKLIKSGVSKYLVGITEELEAWLDLELFGSQAQTKDIVNNNSETSQ